MTKRIEAAAHAKTTPPGISKESSVAASAQGRGVLARRDLAKRRHRRAYESLERVDSAAAALARDALKFWRDAVRGGHRGPDRADEVRQSDLERDVWGPRRRPLGVPGPLRLLEHAARLPRAAHWRT